MALAFVLVFGLVSCARGSGSPTPSALHYTDNGLEMCVPISTHPDLAVGIRVDPRGDRSITIKPIQTVNPSALRVDGTCVVPADPDNRIGSADWPIAAGESWWSKRRQAKGTKLSPGEHHDLILHVHHTGPGNGSLRDVRIKYEQDGQSRVADAHTSVRMTTGTCN
jgi:hypothetical protein